MTPANEVQRAADLLRAGDKRAARELLIDYLRREPQSASAWYLLSFTLPDVEKQKQSLQRALRVDPDMSRARQRLQALTSSGQGAQRPRRRAPTQAQGNAQRAPVAQAAPGLARSQDLSRGLSRRANIGLGVGIGLFLLAGFAGAWVFVQAISGRMAAQRTAASTAEAATLTARQTIGAAVGLPPTWTPTATPPATATPTITPTPSFTPTPSPVPPDPTTAAEMEVIQGQVSDLRGLEAAGSSNSYVITSIRVRPILESAFRAGGGSEAQVEELARVLEALGLIKPSYDLYTNVLNGLTDSLGGFYLPWSDEIFVIGSRFAGVERWVYSHEYTHALVDQHYDIDALGVYPLCERTQDECRAIEALVEGDATLLMAQWLEQYATPQDFQDILAYNPPARTLPDQFPPPYALPDGSFPYNQGLDFAEFIYSRGSWARVNQVYTDLPVSTEQILHPQKYLQGEGPIAVERVDLTTAFGPEWRLLEEDRLGEWSTFLLLGYAADVQSQIDVSLAEQAAAGWGGDRYTVYIHDESGEVSLIARWVWDTPADATEFARELRSVQNGRFRGEVVELGRGDCWTSLGQVSCVLTTDRETLWLLTPSSELITRLHVIYPAFE